MTNDMNRPQQPLPAAGGSGGQQHNPYAPPQPQYGQPQQTQPQYGQPQQAQPQYGQPQQAQPRGEHLRAAVPGADVFPAPTPGSRSGRRRRSTVALVAGALGVAGIAAGAYAVVGAWSNGGEQADVALPATAVAAATFDLDPSPAQKVDALRFAAKFPRGRALDWDSPDNSPRRAVYEELTKELTQAPAWDQVDPWLGDRAGIAVLPPSAAGAQPSAVVAIQVRDLDAATSSLSQLRTDGGNPVGVAGKDGWVLLATTEPEARAALNAALAEPLAEAPTYAADLAALGEQGVASVWVDYARLSSTALSSTALSVAGAPQNVAGMASGHGAATLRFAGDDLELVGSVRGQKPEQMPGTTPVRLDAPEDVIAVLGIAGLGDLVAGQWDQLSTTVGLGPQSLGAVEQQTGLRLPDDLKVLLGDQLQLVLAGTRDAPQIGVRVVSSAPDLDQRLGVLSRALAAGGRPVAEPRRTDDGYVLDLTDDPAPGLAGGGGLADSAAFTGAVPDAASAQLVFYLDMAKVTSLVGGDAMSAERRQTVEAVQGIGMSVSRSGDDVSDFRVRLTTR